MKMLAHAQDEDRAGGRPCGRGTPAGSPPRRPCRAGRARSLQATPDLRRISWASTVVSLSSRSTIGTVMWRFRPSTNALTFSACAPAVPSMFSGRPTTTAAGSCRRTRSATACDVLPRAHAREGVEARRQGRRVVGERHADPALSHVEGQITHRPVEYNVGVMCVRSRGRTPAPLALAAGIDV